MAAPLEGPQAFLSANSSSMQTMSMKSLTELKPTDPERSFAGLDPVWMLSESNRLLTGETRIV
ncbi:MAG TPA: hypothetical protein DCZ95_07185 [Verrucomicrobia bacterium]|nr:MAG: hypothetical protein A2X46_05485 [Lentisphaerae bacterium GWF2_57_35]HBA83858.1 hypothetical protein [Verrucomicrobiota bacterium]